MDRKHLHNYRVVQRNLVYIIGVPASIASEETLRKAEYFGQYGRINKVVVHRNHSSSHTTVSAYITFAFKDDAKAAIQALEGFWLEGHQTRASFGTTKYCNNFIRGVPCNNPDCVYLHELGEDEDRFTKEEIQVTGLHCTPLLPSPPLPSCVPLTQHTLLLTHLLSAHVTCLVLVLLPLCLSSLCVSAGGIQQAATTTR